MDFTTVSGIRMYNLTHCSCSTNGQYKRCLHTLSREYIVGVTEAPRNIVQADLSNARQGRSDRSVRKKVDTCQCFICDVPNGNEFNHASHFAGMRHAKQVKQLCQALRSPSTQTKWRNCVLERTPARELARGQVVLVVVDLTAFEILQGTVTGLTKHAKSSIHTHVAISATTEYILTGGEKVLRVFDGDDDPFSRAKSPTPRTAGTSPMKASRLPKNVSLMPPSPPSPPPEFLLQREKNIEANNEMLKTLDFQQFLPSPPPLPKKRKRKKPRPQTFSRLQTCDIAYVVKALLGPNQSNHRPPMPYTFLPDRIRLMQEQGIDGWESGVINTDAGPGEHWIVAMWNNTPEIVLWEMYDQVNSCMEDVIVYLKD